MTLLDATFFYGVPPGENEALALDQVRRVYGIRNIRVYEDRHAIEVEYDASRLGEPDIAALLRSAGLEIRQIVNAAV